MSLAKDDTIASTTPSRCATCSKGEARGTGLRQSLPIPPIDDSPFRVVDYPPDKLALPFKDPNGILKQYKWDNGSTLFVQFMHPYQKFHEQYKSYHQRIVDMIVAVAPTWETCTNIKFQFIDANSNAFAQMRLTFWTDDEVPDDWENREAYTGNWSYLGQECRGAYPSMNLDFVSLLQEVDNPQTSSQRKEYLMKYMRATILHEFGHALGFIHEQLRGDRDAAFELDIDKIIKDNQKRMGWTPEQTRNQINDLYRMDYLNASTFDIKSIMIYSFSADQVKQVPGKAGKVDETFELSNVDRQWASIVYPPM